jgi:hypothetical protein
MSVSASAFAPCCPSGSGVLTKYKNTTTAIIRIRIIAIILKIFSLCKIVLFDKLLKVLK